MAAAVPSLGCHSKGADVSSSCTVPVWTMNDIRVNHRPWSTGPNNIVSSIRKGRSTLTNGRSAARHVSEQLRAHEPHSRQNWPGTSKGHPTEEQSVTDQTENGLDDLSAGRFDAHGNVVLGGDSAELENRSAGLNTEKPRLSSLEKKLFVVEQNLIRWLKSFPEHCPLRHSL